VGVPNLTGEIPQHLEALQRYALRLRKDRAAADDLVQDVVARALDRHDQFETGTNLRAWLLTIMHNLHVNQMRRQQCRPDSIAWTRELPIPEHPGGQDGRLILRDLKRALINLSSEQRCVLLLVAIQGCTYEETAARLHIPVGTVMSRLSRARDHVRRSLADEAPRQRGASPLRPMPRKAELCQ